MPGGLKTLTAVVVVALALLAALLAFSTATGRTEWFFAVSNARFTRDGKPASGCLLKNRDTEERTMYVTLTVDGKRESYKVFLPAGERGFVSGCGHWTPPRWPAYPVQVSWCANADPCFGGFQMRQPDPKLNYGATFIEFTADRGDRIRVSW